MGLVIPANCYWCVNTDHVSESPVRLTLPPATNSLYGSRLWYLNTFMDPLDLRLRNDRELSGRWGGRILGSGQAQAGEAAPLSSDTSRTYEWDPQYLIYNRPKRDPFNKRFRQSTGTVVHDLRSFPDQHNPINNRFQQLTGVAVQTCDPIRRPQWSW